ncbi:hypothetical protein HY486_02505 [Candidatus Woesearchaeota archaeon]|nr:hypothetical protein [Candidatus Woesearchaeota archaeon]
MNNSGKLSLMTSEPNAALPELTNLIAESKQASLERAEKRKKAEKVMGETGKIWEEVRTMVAATVKKHEEFLPAVKGIFSEGKRWESAKEAGNALVHKVPWLGSYLARQEVNEFLESFIAKTRERIATIRTYVENDEGILSTLKQLRTSISQAEDELVGLAKTRERIEKYGRELDGQYALATEQFKKYKNIPAAELPTEGIELHRAISLLEQSIEEARINNSVAKSRTYELVEDIESSRAIAQQLALYAAMLIDQVAKVGSTLDKKGPMLKQMTQLAKVAELYEKTAGMYTDLNKVLNATMKASGQSLELLAKNHEGLVSSQVFLPDIIDASNQAAESALQALVADEGGAKQALIATLQSLREGNPSAVQRYLAAADSQGTGLSEYVKKLPSPKEEDTP